MEIPKVGDILPITHPPGKHRKILGGEKKISLRNNDTKAQLRVAFWNSPSADLLSFLTWHSPPLLPPSPWTATEPPMGLPHPPWSPSHLSSDGSRHLPYPQFLLLPAAGSWPPWAGSAVAPFSRFQPHFLGGTSLVSDSPLVALASPAPHQSRGLAVLFCASAPVNA